MDLAYEHPPEYLMVPPRQRAKRVLFNEDICVVDNKVFVVRAILELPVRDGPSRFAWGVWMLLSKEEFDRYLVLWRTHTEEGAPPLRGHLTGGVRTYADSDMLEVLGHLRRNKRPSLEVLSETHPLGKDQREGITMEKVHAFLEGVAWC
jgi:hypothetical protein